MRRIWRTRSTLDFAESVSPTPRFAHSLPALFVISDRFFSKMEEFMVEFMEAMRVTFPTLLVQFEDFSTDNAFKYLKMFRDTHRVFNDDIQGTGGVVLSGFMNAARLSSAASGLPLRDHKVLFFGAGSAGVGVAKQLMSFFELQGLSEEEAKSRIYTVDSQGLVTADRKNLAEHKKYFARTDYNGPALRSLPEIVAHIKPTALLGLSTIHSAFTQEVVQLMASLNPRPIIFPLSNPVSLSECEFGQAVEWSSGSVIFASGSPFGRIQWGGYGFEAGQGNNMVSLPLSLSAPLYLVTDHSIKQYSTSSPDLASERFSAAQHTLQTAWSSLPLSPLQTLLPSKRKTTGSSTRA